MSKINVMSITRKNGLIEEYRGYDYAQAEFPGALIIAWEEKGSMKLIPWSEIVDIDAVEIDE